MCTLCTKIKFDCWTKKKVRPCGKQIKQKKHKLDSISSNRWNSGEWSDQKKKRTNERNHHSDSTSTIVKGTKCQFKGRMVCLAPTDSFIRIAALLLLPLLLLHSMLRLVICCDQSRRETANEERKTISVRNEKIRTKKKIIKSTKSESNDEEKKNALIFATVSMWKLFIFHNPMDIHLNISVYKWKCPSFYALSYPLGFGSLHCCYCCCCGCRWDLMPVSRLLSLSHVFELVSVSFFQKGL